MQSINEMIGISFTELVVDETGVSVTYHKFDLKTILCSNVSGDS